MITYKDIAEGKLELYNDIDSPDHGKYRIWYFSPHHMGKQEICVNNVIYPLVIPNWYHYFQINSVLVDGFVRDTSSKWAFGLIPVIYQNSTIMDSEGKTIEIKDNNYYLPVHEKYIPPQLTLSPEYYHVIASFSNFVGHMNEFYKSKEEIDETVNYIKEKLYSEEARRLGGFLD